MRRVRAGGETDKGKLMGLIWASSYFIGLIKVTATSLIYLRLYKSKSREALRCLCRRVLKMHFADDPIKVVDGIQLQCKLAIDGKKRKPLGQDVGAEPGPMGGGYGVPGARSGPYRISIISSYL